MFDVVLLSLLLTLNIFHTFTPCSSASSVNFGQVNASWDHSFLRGVFKTLSRIYDRAKWLYKWLLNDCTQFIKMSVQLFNCQMSVKLSFYSGETASLSKMFFLCLFMILIGLPYPAIAKQRFP